MIEKDYHQDLGIVLEASTNLDVWPNLDWHLLTWNKEDKKVAVEFLIKLIKHFFEVAD